MLKIAVLLLLNVVASILAVVNSLRETPETNFEWKIKKFLDLAPEIGYSLDSRPFNLVNTQWVLRIFPNSEKGKDAAIGHISLYLRKNDFEGEYLVDFQLGCKKADGSEFAVSKDAEQIFKKKDDSWGYSKFINRSELMAYKDILVPEGTLTIFCRVRIKKSIGVIPRITSSIDAGTLSDNFKKLYMSKRFVDVQLMVKSREFFAHKNVLSCRLTSFGSMKGNIPDIIEITDCDPDSFQEFLIFIYTGKLAYVSLKHAMSLYETADKYNLDELKNECARSIIEHDLSVDTIYDILHFAYLHRESMLLEAATDVFITNAKLIIWNEKWEKFLKNDPLQGNKLFQSYVERKN